MPVSPPQILGYLSGCFVMAVTVIIPFGLILWRKKKGFLGAGLVLIGLAASKYLPSLSSLWPCSIRLRAKSIVDETYPDYDIKSLQLDDEVIKEHLSRNLLFFGENGSRDIARSHVIVVGLGGVGSHAAHMILRSGPAKLTLVDFDQVTLSSLNRHAVATRADTGLPKAQVLAEHFRSIFPEVIIQSVPEMYTRSTEEKILGAGQCPDFVIDAIDNLDTKVDLLAACKKRSIAVLCVGGAGAKADPTKLRYVDIQEASIDPLVRSVRHQLRTKHNITSGIDVLLSVEQPRCGLCTTQEQSSASSILDYQVIPNFRIRTIPVLGTSPALFGIAAASWVLCKLAGHPYLPEPVVRFKKLQYETILEQLQDDDVATFGHCENIAVDLDEVSFLVCYVWRGVSAFHKGLSSGRDKGLHRRTAGLKLVRFDSSNDATPSNLVLLTHDEATELMEIGQQAWIIKYPKVAEFVDFKLRQVHDIFGQL